jgi:hypothetical protein
MRRVRKAAAAADVPVISPRVGERVDLSGDLDDAVAAFQDPWWDACSAPEDRD